ncbi:WecB/TagA/CpsF family glycosyltransferase [Lacimicrobium alkaliphilum]|uniref:UDP-N-acetyl-D-mannosaminuronic acid transferase n=1 Tax=Lacimicrobium alkaliphilum TaxID=1526571 RepID=A0ABQ1RRW0_9ALTE|nr:WecB/TagA/CpsF family glycosyltransferase [Lacimicrobium alkaliphilum]GGD76698.1 UDP-N-acetyl-D-mannosaminuronic acid transferase [Lacimicrobium alkaliphilum]
MTAQVLGLQVAITNLSQAIETALTRVHKRQGGYICLANVHMCMEAHDHPAFAEVLSQSCLRLPDGRPLLWMQKLMGYRDARQVRGEDFFLGLCEQAQHQQINVGVFGGTDAMQLQQLTDDLVQRYPQLRLVYRYAPPFRPLTTEEDAEVEKQIRTAGVQLLLVAIGCPKQEQWMASHQHLGPVMVGVGAAVDFVTGNKKRAPLWMQRCGLEWCYRLSQEPRRLLWRYLKHNPRFMLLGLLQLLRYWLAKLIR